MPRINNPELDALIDVELPVLDKGFIRVVDYMGDQRSITKSARVSYGDGTKTVREDRGLIRYLISNYHTSPLESCELQIHMKMPIFVARQIVRHRTACLGGSNKVDFSRPCDGKLTTKTVKEIYDTFQGNTTQIKGVKPRKDKNRDLVIPDEFYSSADLAVLVEISPSNMQQRCSKFGLVSIKDKGQYFVYGKDYLSWLDRPPEKIGVYNKIKSMKLRNVNEDSLAPQHTNVVDIWENGIKDTYRLALENGAEVICTLDHQIFTNKGWMLLKDFFDKDAHTFDPDIQISSIKDQSNIKEPHYIPMDTSVEEHWETIDGWGGRYSISTWGRVISSYGGNQTFKDLVLSKGYLRVGVSEKGNSTSILLHRQIANPFIDNPDNKPFVCHRDGNSLNNNLDNLYWGTPAENSADMYAHDTHRCVRHRFVAIKNITFHKSEMVYDIEVSGDYHNFSCNGVVVHNSLNEYSARYSVMKDEYYMPSLGRIQGQDTVNKQGSDGELPNEIKEIWLRAVEKDLEECSSTYKSALDSGISRELARIGLPINIYTEWYWKMDLHNLLHFLRLRMDSHAQWEVQQYANIIGDIVKAWCPDVFDAFLEYQKDSFSLSSTALQVVRSLLAGEKITQEDSGMNVREWEDLQKTLIG